MLKPLVRKGASNMRKDFSHTLKTSTQILLFSVTAMSIVSLFIGLLLNNIVSDYMFQKNSQYVNTVSAQIQEQIKTTLKNIDFTMQQLSRSQALQDTLYVTNLGETMNIEKVKTIRSEVLINLSLSNQINFIELYSNHSQLYPYTNIPHTRLISEEAIALANEANGAITWLTSHDSKNIYAIKRLLLSEYNYTPGGYVVTSLKTDFLDSLLKNFNDIEGSAVIIQDEKQNTIASFPHEFNFNNPAHKKNYKIISTISDYTKWKISIYIPNTYILRDINWLKSNVLILFSLGCLIFVVLSLFISKYINKPITELKNSITQNMDKLSINTITYRNSDINEFNAKYNELILNNNQLYTELLEKTLLKTKAEMKALQSQVDPHFIVNCLESIYWTLIDNQQIKLSNTVMSLAKLFRYILNENEIVELRKEIKLIELYLHIQQFRFDDKISWDINIVPQALNFNIPKLLIQPLVENAIKHGLEPVSSCVHLKIDITFAEDYLLICFSNNGKSIDPLTLIKINQGFRDGHFNGTVDSGIGLINVYNRIKLYYGKEASMSVKSDVSNGGVSINIRLPYNKC